MAFLADSVLDGGLDYLTANGSRIDICSTEPTTYTDATSTYSLGNKTGLTISAAADDDVSGRKVTVPAITSGAPGSVTATGTAAYWALTDGVGELLATGLLASSQPVTSGATFVMTSIDITIPDA